VKFIDVPRHELLVDEARNIRAIGVAINPLLGQPTPPSN
jgi:hypothetical protein